MPFLQEDIYKIMRNLLEAKSSDNVRHTIVPHPKILYWGLGITISVNPKLSHTCLCRNTVREHNAGDAQKEFETIRNSNPEIPIDKAYTEEEFNGFVRDIIKCSLLSIGQKQLEDEVKSFRAQRLACDQENFAVWRNIQQQHILYWKTRIICFRPSNKIVIMLERNAYVHPDLPPETTENYAKMEYLQLFQTLEIEGHKVQPAIVDASFDSFLKRIHNELTPKTMQLTTPTASTNSNTSNTDTLPIDLPSPPSIGNLNPPYFRTRLNHFLPAHLHNKTDQSKKEEKLTPNAAPFSLRG